MRFPWASFYLHLEQLEHRWLAGSYVGMQFGNMTPTTGLPILGGDPNGLALLTPGRKAGESGIALQAPYAVNALSQSIINGFVGAVSQRGEQPGASSLQLNSRNFTNKLSDFFPTLENHPLFQDDPLQSSDNLSQAAPSPTKSPRFRGYIFSDPGSSEMPKSPSTLGGGEIPFTGATPNPSIADTPPLPVQPSHGADSFQQDIYVANAIGRDSFTIPAEHARIWWTPQRLAEARQWYYENDFTVDMGDPWSTAFAYVITQDVTYARATIDRLMNFEISESELNGVASDNYRWNDWVPVAYDWTYNAMTADERTTFMDRYNHYVSVLNDHDWGGPGMDANNYFWGYFRNELNWAIATYYENPLAGQFLENALVTRWGSFLEYANDEAVGGVAGEGSQYGRYMLSYPMTAMVSMDNFGRDLFSETNFFKEAVFNLIYSTTPAPTYKKDDDHPYPQVFAFGDVETYGGYPGASDFYLGNFMSVMANKYRNLPLGQYARQWIDMVGADSDYYAQPFLYRNDIQCRDFSDLPVDYYAPGAGFLYSRNQWGEQATSILFQLGQATRAGHQHQDMGSFQIWRNGYFLTRNSAGYENIFNGGNSQETISQNGLLFNGSGQAWAYADGSARVLRVQSSEYFSYAAVDLTDTYRSHTRETFDNPFAGRVIREFIYIKPLETTFILDRVESSSDAVPASQVDKTFLLHFPYEPWQENANTIMSQNGDQQLRVTFLGQTPRFNIVDEGDFDGRHEDSSYYQYRLEASLAGQPQSYFLTVLQAKATKTDNVVSRMTQDANSWTITLDHPTLGHARIVLNKGMTSVGGAVGFSLTGTPTNLLPLLDHIQSIRVTDYGPVWGN
jgi:hypothetical protein